MSTLVEICLEDVGGAALAAAAGADALEVCTEVMAALDRWARRPPPRQPRWPTVHPQVRHHQ